MKVLLVQPPIEDFYTTHIRSYPLGLLYLGAALRDVCDVTVMDMRRRKKRKRLASHPFPELAEYYGAGLSGPFSLFGDYYRFGFDEGEIAAAVAAAGPRVLCLSSLFTTYCREALDVARIAKEVDGGIITVAGGLHPTLFPERVLANPFIDYVIRGEGETALRRLVEALSRERGPGAVVEGVCCRKGDGMRISGVNVERRIEGLPDRGLIEAGDYRLGRKRYAFLLTSRGCPFHCAFCGRPEIPYRERALAGIEEEIDQCERLGIGAIDFEDDMLNLDPVRFRAVLDLFRGRDLTLSAMNGIYSESLDVPTLDTMFEAGFRRLNFSLVDAGEEVVRQYGRPFSGRFLELLPHLESSPFTLETHFILGLPGQRVGDVIDTVVFLMGRRLLPGPSVYYPVPNSALFDAAIGGGWDGEVTHMRSSALFEANPLMPRKSLYTVMKLTRFVNFVKLMIDRYPGLGSITELMDFLEAEGNGRDAFMLRALVEEGRFLSYDGRRSGFFEDPTDRAVVSLFFDRGRGKAIRGFKTGNAVVLS